MNNLNLLRIMMCVFSIKPSTLYNSAGGMGTLYYSCYPLMAFIGQKLFVETFGDLLGLTGHVRATNPRFAHNILMLFKPIYSRPIRD